jgi:hypothetical protein
VKFAVNLFRSGFNVFGVPSGRAIRSQSFFEQKKLKKRISASIPNANPYSLELFGVIGFLK